MTVQILFVYSSADGRWGCFRSLAVMTSSAVNIRVLCADMFSVLLPNPTWSGTAWSFVTLFAPFSPT